ncbi:MAG TPA: alpha/beta fold hydrolase [Gryllotalpicola sp.]
MTATRALIPSQPRIAYLTAGSGTEVVVLLHGVGSSASTWHLLIPALPQELRVVAPDFRGHGASDAPPGPYRLDDFVDDLVRLLDELSLAKVHLVGFSLGAIIAEAAAIAHPERVASLILLNSIADRLPAERERALARLEAVRSTPPAELAQASASRWFTPDFIAQRPELVGEEVRIVSQTKPEPYAAAYEVLARAEIIDEVGAITAPTLIVTGENDVGSTPRMSRELHTRIPGSELHIVPGLQHYLHAEAAAVIAELIGRFIADHRLEP